MSAKSDGCYKAEAPPSFVGQQMMTAAHGRSVVNPLYTIYGCFDTTGAAVKCAEGSSCAADRERERHTTVHASQRQGAGRGSRG